MTKTNEELIAIAIPVYNVEKYLEECLDSVINQTYQNWKCVLVDDSSPDSSGKICDEYAKKDSRFHVIHKGENEGLPYARQTGANYARQTGAKYITFIDSDDYVDKRYLEVLYKNMIEHDADLSTISPKGFFGKINSTISYDKEEIINIKGKLEITRNRLIKVGEPAFHRYCWGSLYKTELLEDMDWDLNDDNGNPFAEDKRFNMQYSLKCKNYVSSTLPLYFYRSNPNSIIRTNPLMSLLKGVDFAENAITYYRDYLKYDFSSEIEIEIAVLLLSIANVISDSKNISKNDSLHAKSVINKYKNFKTPFDIPKKSKIALVILLKFPFPVYQLIRKICATLNLVENKRLN